MFDAIWARYARLQPQFRCPSGLAEDHLISGYGEREHMMQTNPSDSVRYLADHVIEDRNRVCITGESYGGYAAMTGITPRSGVCSCAVAVAGVVDLGRMLAEDSDKIGSTPNATLPSGSVSTSNCFWSSE